MRLLFLSIILLLLSGGAYANAPSFLPKEAGQQLVINNRILVKMNDRTISVLDVMKTMDMHLSRYYPEVANSPIARYQFYSSNWRHVLNQMIVGELMMADAEKREIKVSDGDVREEIQARWGPNVMAALEKIGLSYEEARERVHEEMLRQRMEWFRVTSKALQKVTLKEIKEAYSAKYQPSEEWRYQTLSIRSKNSAKSKDLAEKIFNWIQQEHLSLESASQKVQEETSLEEVSFNLSPEYQEENKNLSFSLREVLACLNIGAVSRPIEQTSKDQSVVYRLFYLQDHIKKEPPPFEAMVPQIKEDLLQQAAGEAMEMYVEKLHKQFGYDTKALDISEDFVPFVLIGP